MQNSNYPNILVISNNSFSYTKNNGKTLASFFKRFPDNNIAQLYFNKEKPQSDNCSNYFRITDEEILKSIFRQLTPGQIIKNDKEGETTETIQSLSYKSILKKMQLFRYLREYIWKFGNWENDKLEKWLEDFSPDIIFFCAGDSGFAYNVTEHIKDKFNAKLIVYVTDDYVLPRKISSPLGVVRRKNIYKKMAKTVRSSELFLTISEKMRKEYLDLFGKDSDIVMNMPENMKIDIQEMKNDNEIIKLVYAGGMHYQRYKTLHLLAKAILKYNNGNPSKKAYLYIYSNQKPSKRVLKLLNQYGASQYRGNLNESEVKTILNTCDIPVHVEAFDRKSIEATRLSVSTKISEYLSLDKSILAIGPSGIASMEYLKELAYCITNKNKIEEDLRNFLNDEALRAEISTNSTKAYIKLKGKITEKGNFEKKILSVL